MRKYRGCSETVNIVASLVRVCEKEKGEIRPCKKWSKWNLNLRRPWMSFWKLRLFKLSNESFWRVWSGQGQGQGGGTRSGFMNHGFRRKIWKLKNQRQTIQNLHLRGRKVLLPFQTLQTKTGESLFTSFPFSFYADFPSLLVLASQMTNYQVYLLY